jgi:para-aminobenzoate synthetase/4-amino-4-deoxychorismate lyase
MHLRVVLGHKPALVFERPLRVWAPRTLSAAVAALEEAESALNAGLNVAGALSYELGALMHGIRARVPAVPLLILGAFGEPQRHELDSGGAPFAMTAPLARVERPAYAAAVRYLLSRIRDGEIYQANYTVPFDLGFAGDPFALYRFLAQRAQVPYAAYLEHASATVASLSPELFLQFYGDRIWTKPMKGTADPARAQELQHEKNRAEHVMIVDLLRNDLHRICSAVDVPKLFEVERYPTFATMTSTVRGTLREGTTFLQVLQAAFPCGSVTGAPKRAAMQHIAEVEGCARGFYTGSIGYLTPQRKGWWNVPIRTVQFERGATCARFDAGGGIVSDSTADGEWQEVRLKSRVLSDAHADFALLETFPAGSAHAPAHVRRLMASSALFGLDLDALAVSERLETPPGLRRLLRLRASRDRLRVLYEPVAHTDEPVRICIARHRVQSDDPFLRHKTSWRPLHEAAWRDACERGCFDALLQNERGEITEGTRTNVFAQIDGCLYTPPLGCGVLPGVLRAQLLERGRATERILTERDLREAQTLYVGNSARGLLKADLITENAIAHV